jgi:hypothetical protein
VKTVDGAHPSFLELDRHALGAGRPETASHLAGCDSCRAHVAPVESAADVPAWALRLEARPPRFAWPATMRLRRFGWGVTAFACVLAVWIAVGQPGKRATSIDGAGPYVGTKGGPVLWLHVKRGDRVEIWNGSEPIHPGDLLRLTVQPDRYRHISVFGADRTPNAYTRLYDAAVAAGQATALPFSWKVDAQPGNETLVVVLGSESVSPDQVPKILAHTDESRQWSRRLVLSKATSGDGAPP